MALGSGAIIAIIKQHFQFMYRISLENKLVILYWLTRILWCTLTELKIIDIYRIDVLISEDTRLCSSFMN